MSWIVHYIKSFLLFATVSSRTATIEQKKDLWEKLGYERRGIIIPKLDESTDLCFPDEIIDEESISAAQNNQNTSFGSDACHETTITGNCPSFVTIEEAKSESTNNPFFEIVKPVGKYPNCIAVFKCHFKNAQVNSNDDVQFVSDDKEERDFLNYYDPIPVDQRGTQFLKIDKKNSVAYTREFHISKGIENCYKCVVNGFSSNTARLEGCKVQKGSIDVCPMLRIPGKPDPRLYVQSMTKGCCGFFRCIVDCEGGGADCDANHFDFNIKVPKNRYLNPFSKEWFQRYTFYSINFTDRQRDVTRIGKIIGLKFFHYMRTEWRCTFRGKSSNVVTPVVPKLCDWFPADRNVYVPPGPAYEEVTLTERDEYIVYLLVFLVFFLLCVLIKRIANVKMKKIYERFSAKQCKRDSKFQN